MDISYVCSAPYIVLTVKSCSLCTPNPIAVCLLPEDEWIICARSLPQISAVVLTFMSVLLFQALNGY